MFFDLPQLLRGFLYWKDHLKKKEWSSTQQASNETVSIKISGGTFYQIQTEIYIYIISME